MGGGGVRGWLLRVRLCGAALGSPGAADPLPSGTGVARRLPWRGRRASSRKWCPSTNTETQLYVKLFTLLVYTKISNLYWIHMFLMMAVPGN